MSVDDEGADRVDVEHLLKVGDGVGEVVGPRPLREGYRRTPKGQLESDSSLHSTRGASHLDRNTSTMNASLEVAELGHSSLDGLLGHLRVGDVDLQVQRLVLADRLGERCTLLFRDHVEEYHVGTPTDELGRNSAADASSSARDDESVSRNGDH